MARWRRAARRTTSRRCRRRPASIFRRSRPGLSSRWWRSIPGRGQVSVTQRRVQISVDVEILDQREGKTLWQRQGLTVDGEYDPPKEADGRKIALSKLVNEIVDGAQSQW